MVGERADRSTRYQLTFGKACPAVVSLAASVARITLRSGPVSWDVSTSAARPTFMMTLSLTTVCVTSGVTTVNVIS